MRYARLALICAVLATTAYAASVPAVQKLLPPANAVKSFTILANSLVYGKGSDLAKIYNGGYELYTKNGVVDAARQMYQNGNDYVELTVHTMKSNKAALDFLKYWQKQNDVKQLTKTKGSTGFTVTKPSVTAYSVRGKYLTTASAFHESGQARKDAKGFVAAVEKRIGKP